MALKIKMKIGPIYILYIQHRPFRKEFLELNDGEYLLLMLTSEDHRSQA